MTNHSSKTVAIVAAMHGDEIYGIELYNEFCKMYQDLAQNVRLLIGNEEAHKRKTRYIKEDMSRIYGLGTNSVDQLQVTRLDQEIKKYNPDYIIDIHTTRRSSGIFFISDSVNSVRKDIINMLDIDVCVMKNSVIKRSLIGNYDNAVSLEYSLRDISNNTTKQFVDALHNLIVNKIDSTCDKRIFEAAALITKDQWSKYPHLKSYDEKPEGIALMVPKDIDEMDAEYYGFWCNLQGNNRGEV